MYDKKQEQQFRKTCANWLAKIAKVLSPFFPISAPCHYHYHYGHSTRWHTHRMIQCQSCLVLLPHCCYLLEVSHHQRVMFPMRSLPSALAFSDITSCCFTSHIPLSLLLSLSPSPPSPPHHNHHHYHHHYHHHTTITIITTIITPPLSLLSVIINHLSTMNITITISP